MIPDGEQVNIRNFNQSDTDYWIKTNIQTTWKIPLKIILSDNGKLSQLLNHGSSEVKMNVTIEILKQEVEKKNETIVRNCKFNAFVCCCFCLFFEVYLRQTQFFANKKERTVDKNYTPFAMWLELLEHIHQNLKGRAQTYVFWLERKEDEKKEIF